jgi:hypothetical protein
MASAIGNAVGTTGGHRFDAPRVAFGEPVMVGEPAMSGREQRDEGPDPVREALEGCHEEAPKHAVAVVFWRQEHAFNHAGVSDLFWYPFLVLRFLCYPFLNYSVNHGGRLWDLKPCALAFSIFSVSHGS